MSPRPRVSDTEDEFSGGLNTTADDSQLADNELRRADNSRLTVFGAVTKRNGTQRTSTSALFNNMQVKGGFGWVPNGAAIQQLAIANGRLFTGAYSIGMTWTLQTGALSTTAYSSFAGFRNATGERAYIADGALRSWDGTTLVTSIATTPSVTNIVAQNRRLLGVNGADETLFYSDLDNGDKLGVAGTGGGQDVVRTFGQQANIALMALGSSVIIFHRAAVSRFTGISQDDIAIQSGTRGISNDTGTISPLSLVTVENVGFFLSERGFYQVTEAGVQAMGPKIESVIQGLDQSQFFRVVGAHNKAYKEVWWYLPDVGIYAYNYRVGAWTGPHTGIFTSSVVGSLWRTTDASGSPVLLSGHADGFVRRVDQDGLYQDDYAVDLTGSVPYTQASQARRFYFNSPENEKAMNAIYAQVQTNGSRRSTINWQTETASGSYTLPYMAAGTWGSGTWDMTATWNAAGSSSSDRAFINGRGKYLDITFADDGTANPVLSRLVADGFNYGARY